MSKSDNLVIDAQFTKLLYPLAPDEYAQLEQNLLRDGCLHALTAWRENGKLILLDGHNRHAICTKHGIPFKVDTIEIESRDWAIVWIRRNQLGRRNMPDDARAIAAALLLDDLKKLALTERGKEARKHGGKATPEQQAERERMSTAVGRQAIKGKKAKKDNLAAVAKSAKVSERRVRRARAFLKQTVAAMGKDGAQKVYDEIGQGKLTISRAQQEIKQQAKIALAEKIRREPAPAPTGPYRVQAVDPPWPYASRADDPTHRAGNPYKSLTVDQIKALPIAEHAHTDSILWLWTTNAFIGEALECLAAWGFEKKTILTWVKDRMGTGDYLRGQTEHCLMAVRGSPIRTPLKNQTTALFGPLREHSQKPDEFYALVESLCPGSKAEWFGRQERPGWTQIVGDVTKLLDAAMKQCVCLTLLGIVAGRKAVLKTKAWYFSVTMLARSISLPLVAISLIATTIIETGKVVFACVHAARSDFGLLAWSDRRGSRP